MSVEVGRSIRAKTTVNVSQRNELYLSISNPQWSSLCYDLELGILVLVLKLAKGLPATPSHLEVVNKR